MYVDIYRGLCAPHMAHLRAHIISESLPVNDVQIPNLAGLPEVLSDHKRPSICGTETGGGGKFAMSGEPMLCTALSANLSLYTDDHLRLRGREERDGGGQDNAQQHQTLVVDAAVVLEQAQRHRALGVLRQKEVNRHAHDAVAGAKLMQQQR